LRHCRLRAAFRTGYSRCVLNRRSHRTRACTSSKVKHCRKAISIGCKQRSHNSPSRAVKIPVAPSPRSVYQGVPGVPVRRGFCGI